MLKKYFSGKKHLSLLAALIFVLNSLGILGFVQVLADDITVTDNADTPAALNTSLIYGKTPYFIAGYNNGTEVNFGKNPTIGNMTDGNTGTGADLSGVQYSTSSGLINTADTIKVYTDIIYYVEIGGEKASIENFWMQNSVNSNLMTYQYEIYVADTQTGLGKATSLAAKVTNGNKAAKQLVSFDQPAVGSWLMLRIINGVQPEHKDAGSSYARLLELAVFGTAGGSYTVTDGSNAPEVLNKSLIYARNPLVICGYDNGVPTDFSTNGNKSRLTDGDTVSGIDLNVALFTSGKELRNKNELLVHFDMVYRIAEEGKTAAVEKFWMLNASNEILTTHQYEIYVADTQEDLGKPPALAASVTNINKAEKQLITFKAPVSGSYVMVRITNGVQPSYKDGSFGDDLSYARLKEIAVFGTVESSYEGYTVDDNSDTPAALNTSLIYGKMPYYIAGYNEGSEINMANNPLKGNMTDGNAGTGADLSGVEYSSSSGLINTADTIKVYTDIVYRLGHDGEEAVIEKIWMQNTSNPNLITYKYEIYIANERKDLGNASSLKASVINASKAEKQLVSFDDPKKGSWLMVRIVDGVQPEHKEPGSSYARIREIAAFGSEPYRNYTEAPVSINTEDSYYKALGTSLISGAKPSMMKKNGFNIPIRNYAAITDGNVKTTESPGAEQKEGEYLDIVYYLGEEPMAIEKLLYTGFYTSDIGYYTGEYKIYISTEYEDLFSESSCAYRYNYEINGIRFGQAVEFKDAPVGCYVALRLIKTVVQANIDWPWARISEFAIYGDKAVLPLNPTNLAENMPLEIYQTDSSGKRTDISKSLWPSSDSLTNGIMTDDVKITVNGTKLDLLFNLCQDAAVDKIVISSANVTSAYLKRYKIYATEDFNKIWSDTALVYQYENELPAQSGTAEFPNGLKARYVRIEIPKNTGGETCNLSEIEIIGMDNQKLKNKDLMIAVDPNTMYVVEKEINSDNMDYLVLKQEVLAHINNSDKDTVTGIFGAEIGKSTLNYVIDFSTLKNFNQITAYFNENNELWMPAKANIYVGQTIEQVLKEGRRPLASFNGIPQDGIYNVAVAPTFGQYVCIEFEDMNKDYYFNKEITPALTEISVMGTRVKGMQTDPDNDYLLHFEDQSTGIQWDIVRLSVDDIFTKVASSKLVRTNAGNAQKLSLKHDMYLKILDNAVYELQFFDAEGNRITDLEGRTVCVYFPLPKGADPDMLIIGDACDKNRVELLDTILSDKGDFVYTSVPNAERTSFTLTLMTTPDDPYWLTVRDDEGSPSGDPAGTGQKPISALLTVFILSMAIVLKYKNKISLRETKVL